MEDLHKAWGTNIAKRRADLGLTQRELAERVQVEQQAVSKWEKGQTAPRTDLKLRLAVALGVDANDLFPLTAVEAAS